MMAIAMLVSILVFLAVLLVPDSLLDRIFKSIALVYPQAYFWGV